MWEPVLTTDWGSPSPSLPGFVDDPRVRHYFDRGRTLSAMLGGTGRLNALATEKQIGFRMKDVIWDAALVYSASADWGSAAKLLVAPVVKYRDLLSAAL